MKKRNFKLKKQNQKTRIFLLFLISHLSLYLFLAPPPKISRRPKTSLLILELDLFVQKYERNLVSLYFNKKLLSKEAKLLIPKANGKYLVEVPKDELNLLAPFLKKKISAYPRSLKFNLKRRNKNEIVF